MKDNLEPHQLVADGLDRLEQAAAFLRVSRTQLYLMMAKGELPFVKLGRCRRIPHRALIELAARNLDDRRWMRLLVEEPTEQQHGDAKE